MLDHALEVMQGAAQYVTDMFGEVRISFSTAKDFDTAGIPGAKSWITEVVTKVDIEAQKMILESLRDKGLHRNIGLVAEEDTPELVYFAVPEAQPQFRWVLDSLDGTSNFIMAYPGAVDDLRGRFGVDFKRDPRHHGLSLGLQYIGPHLSEADQAKSDFYLTPGAFLFSIVILPNLEDGPEVYIARQGLGATLNGEKLKINDQSDYNPKRDIILVNSKADFAKKCLTRWEQPVCTVYAITGIASGKHNGYFAMNSFLHDFGPSSLVLTEAGGYCATHIKNEHRSRGKWTLNKEMNPNDVTGEGNKSRLDWLMCGRNADFTTSLDIHVRKTRPRYHLKSD